MTIHPPPQCLFSRENTIATISYIFIQFILWMLGSKLSNRGPDISVAKLVILEAGLWLKQNWTHGSLSPCSGFLTQRSSHERLQCLLGPLTGRRMVSLDQATDFQGLLSHGQLLLIKIKYTVYRTSGKYFSFRSHSYIRLKMGVINIRLKYYVLW